MKHRLNLLFLSILFMTSSYAQPKIEVGITTEGSWCMKKEANIEHNYPGKSNWGTGLGGYITVPVWWRFSISSGLGYRYAQFQKGDPVWSPSADDSGTKQVSYDWMKFHRNYIVVPLTLRLYLSSKFHATGGFEACRLLGYDTYKRHKPEYNRIIGFGSRIGKLNWELKYVRGLKKQVVSTVKPDADISNNDETNDWFKYRTSMLQLSLSYPLWQK